MRRRKIGERVLSPRIPESVRQTTIKLTDFSGSLDEFAREYLGGALTYTDPAISDGYITICSYQTAYALRVAAEYGAPDRPVRVTARISEGKFELHIVIKDNLELEALATITKALRRAGFSIIPYEDGVRAETKFERDKLLKIYEKSSRVFLQDLYTIFFV